MHPLAERTTNETILVPALKRLDPWKCLVTGGLFIVPYKDISTIRVLMHFAPDLFLYMYIKLTVIHCHHRARHFLLMAWIFGPCPLASHLARSARRTHDIHHGCHQPRQCMTSEHL